MNLTDRMKNLPIEKWEKVKKRGEVVYVQGPYVVSQCGHGVWLEVDGKTFGRLDDKNWYLDVVEECV